MQRHRNKHVAMFELTSPQTGSSFTSKPPWEKFTPCNKITDAGVFENYSCSTRMLLQGETSRGKHKTVRWILPLLGMNIDKDNGAELTVPVYKVVFVELQKPWGNVTRHPLEDQRVGSLTVSHTTTVQVAFQITLRGDRTGCSDGL